MCGVIFAFERKKENLHSLRIRSEAALNQLKHRGPDEQKLYCCDNWIIGHTRLSIVDLAGSQQPMISPDKKKYLSFNGEIYNFRELKAKLASRWAFTTTGDTEVLLAGLSIYGTSFISMLDGMWAFVLWDKERQTILASRDPLGKKPLYYRNNSNGIYLASELAALKHLDKSKWDEDKSSTVSIIKYGFTQPGATIYQGTFELKPGHNLRWSLEEDVSENQYWELRPTRGSKVAFLEASQLIEQKIEAAVKKRLVADVEIGAFLSGGLDSSVIATIAQRHTPSQLSTYTIKFSDKGYDESQYAQALASRINSRHFEIVIGQPKLDDFVELQQNSLGQPFGDPSLLPTYSLCKATAKHVKVALSGDGADEVFSGYQRYQARVLLNWYLKVPKKLRRSAEAIISLIPDSYRHHSRSLIKKAKEFSKIASSEEYNKAYFAPIITDSLFIAEINQKENQYEHIPSAISLEEMMHRDMLIYLPQDILTKVDRASMYSSLEVRSPFLDIDLIETAFSLPMTYHRSALKGKKLLRCIYGQSLPQQIVERKKQGFGNPIYKWFLGSLGDEILTMNRKADSILSTPIIMEMLGKHRSGQKDMSLPLWNILSYLLWKTRTSP